jgi:hypothetical protein
MCVAVARPARAICQRWSRAAHARRWCTVTPGSSLWTRTHPGHLRPLKTPYAAPTPRECVGPSHALRVRAPTRRDVHAARHLAVSSAPFAPYPSTYHAESPRSSHPCSVSRAPGPKLGRAEPPRAFVAASEAPPLPLGSAAFQTCPPFLEPP